MKPRQIGEPMSRNRLSQIPKRPAVVVLTGAGISAESGISTFRDSNGLWENHRVEDVASPEGFRRDPLLVQRFYDMRRRDVQDAEPNEAHRALARLEERLGDDLLVVTQNIDDLHERAGSHRLLHLHGELLRAWCTACDTRHAWHGDLVDGPACPNCGQRKLRPDVVWFGEIPYHLDEIIDAVQGCERFVAIGTSGSVYPAAGLAGAARAAGATTTLLNLESHSNAGFDEVRFGPATQTVPRWVAEITGSQD